MRTRLRWLTALVATFALLAGACGSSDDGGPAAPAATTAAPAATTAAPAATTAAPAATTAAPAATTAAPVADYLGDGSLGTVEVGSGEDIQIRSLNAISGDVAFLGIPNQRGVEMAIADYGSIGGHDVSMGTGLDDLCSADGGQAAAQTIVADESVVGVIGTSCSGAAAAAAPLISEANMVMISGSNTSPSLTSDLAGTAGSNNYAGYYRTAHNDLYQGAAAAGFAVEVLGVSSAAAIHDGDPYTQGLAQAFADAFEALGGTVTTFTAVNKGDTDMIPVLTEIAAGAPEMLFFPIFQPEGDFIVQQASQVPGLDNTTLMAADGLLNSNYMAIAETEGMYFSGPDIRYGSNTNQSTGQTADGFLAAYNDEWGEDPAAPFWAHSYVATTMLLDAIAAASYDDGGTLVIDRAGVREYLAGVTDYSGIIGLMSCDAFGDCGSQKITVIGHADSGDVPASNANVIYEYAPGGSMQVGEPMVVLTATWRGVTADSIHIATTTIDFQWLVDNGFSPNGWGDPQLVWEAMVADLNARGGINGRQVVLDAVRPYSAIPGLGISADAVCLEVAGDFETFVVLGGFLGPAEISNICIPGQQNTVLIGGRTDEERLAQVQAPWIENGTMVKRRMAVFASLLDQNGMIEGRKFVIIGRSDTEETYNVARESMAALGADVVLELLSDQTGGDTEGEDAWWDVMAERVRSAGADSMLMAGGDRAALRNLFWAGIELDLFIMNSETLSSMSSSVTPEMAVGAITLTGLTEQEQFETENSQTNCIAPFEAAHPEIVVGMPDTHEDGVEKWWRSIMTHCTQLQLFEMIATAAGPVLTHDTFREAMESIPQASLPVCPFGSLVPG